MKDSSLSHWVITADQVNSRHRADAVPDALGALAELNESLELPFERTVGDEIQGLAASGRHVVTAVTALTRLDQWRIGVGLGQVDLPLPTRSSEARGGAFIAAREAVDEARRSPTRLALRVAIGVNVATPVIAAPPGDLQLSASGHDEASKTVSRLIYGQLLAAGQAETALITLQALLSRRTQEGWQAMDLLASGLTHRGIATALGVTEAAISQRLRRAMRVEIERAALLAEQLLDRAATRPAQSEGVSQ